MSESTQHDVFTEPWVAAWVTEIEASDTYRTAAATWEGSVALEATDAGGHRRAVFLDLWHGSCRAARVASDGDLERADYVLSADLETWRRVLAGELEPILGLMTGKVKLRRGQLARLTPYMQASKELVACATRVASHIPDRFA
jgi:putative sterol carrier protein